MTPCRSDFFETYKAINPITEISSNLTFFRFFALPIFYVGIKSCSDASYDPTQEKIILQNIYFGYVIYSFSYTSYCPLYSTGGRVV